MQGQTILFVPDEAWLELCLWPTAPWPQPLTCPSHTKQLGTPKCNSSGRWEHSSEAAPGANSL